MRPSVPAVLRYYGIRPNKALGQHFLINDTIAARIVQAAAPDKASVVLEIGAGTGALTHHLVESSEQVVAVEIDSQLYNVLKQDFSACPNLTLMRRDILDVDIADICRSHGVDEVIVVGNLPYNITGPVIEQLMKYSRVIRRAVIMTQEEVGQRLTAQPGGKTYGALTVVLQYAYNIKPLMRVASGSFYPRPAVQSVVTELTPHAHPPVDVHDETFLRHIVRAAFQHRRKMLHHAVKRVSEGDIDMVAARTGIDLKRRGETLSLNEFARLANVLWDLQQAL